MKGALPGNKKRERERTLKEVVGRISAEIKKGFEGKTLKVLVERKRTLGWSGYSLEYVPVIFRDSENLKNEIITVKGRKVKGGFIAGERI